jgi:hypothetical protein
MFTFILGCSNDTVEILMSEYGEIKCSLRSYKFLHKLHSKKNAWEDIGQLLGVQSNRCHKKKWNHCYSSSDLNCKNMRSNVCIVYRARMLINKIVHSQRFRTLPNFADMERFVHRGRRGKKKKKTFGKFGELFLLRSRCAYVIAK